VQQASCFLAALLSFLISTSQLGIGATQQWIEPQRGEQQAVSSSEFLEQLQSSSLNIETVLHRFPFEINSSQIRKPEPAAAQVNYEMPRAASQKEQELSVQTAQYESPPRSSTPIGSGASSPTSYYSSESPAVSSNNHTNVQANPTGGRLQNVLGLDPSLPNFLVGYEAIGIHRSNDSIGPYSQGAGMERLDRDLAGRYTFSRLLGSLERVEFKFTGPLHWDRQSTTSGSIDSNLPLSFSAPFNNASLHHQSHSARLASYELNRCNTGDDHSKFFSGFRLFDYEEQYCLQATQSTTINQMKLKTDNILAGWQLGLHLNRPLSQRLSVGIGTAVGLYGNFTKASLSVGSGNSTIANLKDSKLRLSAMSESVAMVNYRVSQNIVAACGYEAWYFPALATAAAQRLDYSAQVPAFSLRTGDDQLFRGWTVGLSARF